MLFDQNEFTGQVVGEKRGEGKCLDFHPPPHHAHPRKKTVWSHLSSPNDIA